MKKYVTLVCAFVLSVMTFAHDFEVDGYYYTRQSDNTVNISYKGTNYSSSMVYSGDVVVPETIEVDDVTYTVVGVDDGTFNYCTKLTSVTLPKTVTTLGGYIFENDSKLTSVVLGSPTTIGNQNFSGCSSLTSITIYSETVPTTGAKVFLGVDKSKVTMSIPAGSTATYNADDNWSGFTFEELPAEGGNEGGEEGGQEGGEEGGQEENPPLAVSSLTNNFNISVSGNVISASQVVIVYNVLGGFEGKGYSVTVPKNGIYFVTAGNKSYKIYVK